MSELKLQQCRVDGRYDVLECLGRGSYSEVYVARDVAASNGGPQTVVLKALNTHLQGEPDEDLDHTLIVNFRNEAIALDRVRHPYIINRLGHGTAIDLQGRTFHYLVLEYLSGGDLQVLCRRKPLDIEDAFYYLEQVCEGLGHAHSRGVIHRDVKPQNLLLTADQRTVKIADFGVAKLEAADGAITRVGTDIYAAPEHHPLMHTGQLDTASLVARSTLQLTPAADVYSLAKTTYTLLTGESPRRFSQRPITELPPLFSEKPWADSVVRVLQRATQTNPQDRYQSVKEFWDDIRRSVTQPGTSPTDESDEEGEVAPDLFNTRELTIEEVPPAPLEPVFERPIEPSPLSPGSNVQRIFIPITPDEQRGQPPPHPPQQQAPIWEGARGQGEVRTAPADYPPSQYQPARGRRRARKWLVIFLLIVAFAAVLLATYTYMRRRNAAQTVTTADPSALVGREFIAIIDVNLRAGPNGSSPKVGLAEKNSIVKILAVSGGWYQVEITQHGRPKENPNFADQGWADKDFLRPRQ